MSESKVELTKSVAVAILGLCCVLIITNFLLLRRTRHLESAITQQGAEYSIKPGTAVPALAGLTLTNKLVSFAYGQDKRRTLLLVMSPTCHFCDKNWPTWSRLLGKIDTTSFRVLVVNIGSDLSPQYVAEHNLSQLTVLGQTDPTSVSAYRFRLTPQTIIVSPMGTIEKVWTGLLEKHDEEQLKTALEQTDGATQKAS